jgi:hypothetical protein
MKKFLVVVMIMICQAAASAQEAEGQPRRPRAPETPNPSIEKIQPTDKSQETRIVDLSSFLQNRFQFTQDLTGKALKDKQGLCAVHHHELKVVHVPIIYGLVPGYAYPAEVVKKSFPNAATEIFGGCMVMSTKEAKVLRCELCMAFKLRWLTENSKGATALL